MRAAFFTAMSLARIADGCPAAANRIFSISGVSGGAIGAAIYVAAVHQRPIPLSEQRCSFSSIQSKGIYAAHVANVFQKDHLSPMLARMLFSDAAQTIIPRPVDAFDRQLGFEFSLENAFEEAFGSATLSAPFSEFVPSKEHPSTPYLLVNSTSVEGGQHFVGSSFRWQRPGHNPDHIYFFDHFWNPLITDQFSLISLWEQALVFPTYPRPGMLI